MEVDYEKEAQSLMGASSETLREYFKDKTDAQIDAIQTEVLHLNGVPRHVARKAYDIGKKASQEAQQAIRDKCNLLEDKEERVVALLLAYVFVEPRCTEALGDMEKLYDLYMLKNMLSEVQPEQD